MNDGSRNFAPIYCRIVITRTDPAIKKIPQFHKKKLGEILEKITIEKCVPAQ